MAGVETPLMDQVIETLGQWSGYPYLENCERAMELSGKSRLVLFWKTGDSRSGRDEADSVEECCIQESVK